MYNAPSQKIPKRKSFKVREGSAFYKIAQIGARMAAISRGGVN